MAKALWRFLALPSIFLLLLMQFMQAYFLSANANNIREENVTKILASFMHSFSLDLASWAYLMIFPLLLFFLASILKKTGLIRKVLILYYAFVSSFMIAINWIDVQMFAHWNAKLSAKALTYLNTPQMMLASAGYAKAVFFFFMSFFVFVFFWLFYRQILPAFKQQTLAWHTPLIFVGALGLLILALRGGFREIPINQSDAYYSDNHVLNVAGVNSIWNIGNILFQNQNSLNHNPYKIINQDLANQIFEQITFTPVDTSLQVLQHNKPNIIFLALEGVNANCILDYNTANNHMPEVSKLIEEGYTFKNMYASGMRTDQGLVAVLSGFPALPLHTIGAQPEKFQQLPSFALDLKSEGYTNTFFFAGEPEFGSFKAFLVHNGFSKVYSLDDFPKAQQTQDLGAPDEFLFERFLTDSKNFSEPFFSLILTQTTHEPFDMPFNEDIDEDVQRYVNTVKYVDRLIGEWYAQCKDMPWFDNTLFVLSSDHSHTFPGRYWYTDKQRYHIPFVLFGPALKDSWKGQINEQLVNQTDIPMSLAKQLVLPYADYTFSKDIFNPYSPAYSSFIHIHGHDWIREEGECHLNYELDKQTLLEKTKEDSCILENAAYFQVAFQTYMDF